MAYSSYNPLYIVRFVQSVTKVLWAVCATLYKNLALYFAQQPPVAYILISLVLVPCL
jgi:hypothetical protein